jgi:protein-S-isoprenylcysteine O-methyltransferase Ste14
LHAADLIGSDRHLCFVLQYTGVAYFLAACLTTFFAVNVASMLRNAAGREGIVEAEVELPRTLAFTLVVLGTGAFFLLSILYVVLVGVGWGDYVAGGLLQLMFPFDLWVQLGGIVMTVIGYGLFLWSVLARGRYATSWEMRRDQKLVTWGPYRYVRHPSYLAYFILFTGLFFLLLSLLALIPLAAVPGYVHISKVEDRMLRRRFGEAAREYQRVTGGFMPRRRRE